MNFLYFVIALCDPVCVANLCHRVYGIYGWEESNLLPRSYFCIEIHIYLNGPLNGPNCSFNNGRSSMSSVVYGNSRYALIEASSYSGFVLYA